MKVRMKVHIYIYEGNNVLRTFDSKVKIPIFNRRTLACLYWWPSFVRACQQFVSLKLVYYLIVYI